MPSVPDLGRRLIHSPLLRFFSSAVVDQALLSAANFGVGLLLIRHVSDLEYGHYVLATTAIMLMMSVQGAFVDGPLLVLAARRPEQRDAMVGAVVADHRRIAAIVAIASLAGIGVLRLMHRLDDNLALLAASFALAAWASLRRDLLRYLLMLFSRPHLLLAADGVFVALQLAGAIWAAFGARPGMATFWVLLALAVANLAGLQPVNRSIARDPGWSRAGAPGIWKQISQLGVWATAGAVIYWTCSQGYNYIIAGRFDVAAVAGVAATRLLMMPVNLLTTGVKALLVPMAARWQSESGIQVVTRRLFLFAAGLGAMALVYCLPLWLLRDWILREILRKDIAQFDALLLSWMAWALLGMVRDMVQTGIIALGRFKRLAALALLTAVISIATMLLAMGIYGVVGALFGVVLGEVVNLAGVLVLLAIELKRPENLIPASNPQTRVREA